MEHTPDENTNWLIDLLSQPPPAKEVKEVKPKQKVKPTVYHDDISETSRRYQDDITTPEKTIAYMVESTLITIEIMIRRRTLTKIDFARQCEIAQAGMDHLGAGFLYQGRSLLVRDAKQTVFKYFLNERHRMFPPPKPKKRKRRKRRPR